MLLEAFSSEVASAAPRSFKRNPEFITPPGLRARVNFWKDVFAKYEKNQISIHHRAYPQITFEILDLRQEAAVMSEVLFEKYRSKAIDARIKQYYVALKPLAAGGAPTTELQQLIADKMPPIKGVGNVFQWTVKGEFVRSQSGIRQKWVEAIQRSGRYLPTMERIFVDQYSLPIELTRLPFVESSFNYAAYSSVGAAGIWQFMPRTGKQFRLTVNSVVDERRDPIKATDASARYLSSAYSSIRTWPLAITSYNHGVGGVLKRVREAGTTDIVRLLEHPTDRPFGFASSNFFPSFLAAVECYDERKVLFPDAVPEKSLRLTEYRLPRSMSVSHVSRQLGLSVERLKEANYALLDRVWQGRSAIPAGYVLRVPEEYGIRLASLRAPESGAASVTAPAASSVYGGLVYKVRRGDTLGAIGKRYGVSVTHLMELNNLRSSTVRVGQMLRIKEREHERSERATEPERGTSNSSPTELSDRSEVLHVVRPGETLYAIGRRYGTSVEALVRTNELTEHRIQVGQKLVVDGPRSASSGAPSRSSQAPQSYLSYKVRKGDTLGKIAQKFRISVQALRDANKVRGDIVRVGQTLRVPRS